MPTRWASTLTRVVTLGTVDAVPFVLVKYGSGRGCPGTAGVNNLFTIIFVKGVDKSISVWYNIGTVKETR